MWNTLPESARATAQNGLTPLVSKLEAAAQPVMALPAVGESIRPYITEMLKNLRSLIYQNSWQGVELLHKDLQAYIRGANAGVSKRTKSHRRVKAKGKSAPAPAQKS